MMHKGARVWLAPAVCVVVALVLLFVMSGYQGKNANSHANRAQVNGELDSANGLAREEDVAADRDLKGITEGEFEDSKYLFQKTEKGLPPERTNEVLDMFEAAPFSPGTTSGNFLEKLNQSCNEANRSKNKNENNSRKPLDNASKGVVALSWEEKDALPITGKRVLTAYESLENAVLVTSGYLDLKGNAWAASIQGGCSWVDLIVITTTNDKASTARVVRLLPEGEVG